MTISTKQDREDIEIGDFLHFLPRGPNATKADIEYTGAKSEVDELGIRKRARDGSFTEEHKTFYHYVREKVKDSYNAYPGSDKFAAEVPSELDSSFIRSVKRSVSNALPAVFYVDGDERYQDHFPIHEMIKSYHRNKHSRYMRM